MRPVGAGQRDEARQRAGHGDDAEDARVWDGLVVRSACAFVAQQKRDAERLVEHAREGVGGVDGDRGEERDRPRSRRTRGRGRGRGRRARASLRMRMFSRSQGGEELVVPAGVLGVDELVRG